MRAGPFRSILRQMGEQAYLDTLFFLASYRNGEKETLLSASCSYLKLLICFFHTNLPLFTFNCGLQLTCYCYSSFSASVLFRYISSHLYLVHGKYFVLRFVVL
mgnify:CR=1 FL=1